MIVTQPGECDAVALKACMWQGFRVKGLLAFGLILRITVLGQMDSPVDTSLRWPPFFGFCFVYCVFCKFV